MSFTRTILFVVSVAFFILAACAAPSPSQRPSSSNPAVSPSTTQANEMKDDNPNVTHVRNVVNLRQPQLQNLYKKQTQVNAMQGALNIKLFITEDGTVQNVDITPDAGNLSSEFIAQVRKEVMAWKFILHDKMIYSFKVQFRKM